MSRLLTATITFGGYAAQHLTDAADVGRIGQVSVVDTHGATGSGLGSDGLGNRYGGEGVHFVKCGKRVRLNGEEMSVNECEGE